jgi:RND family efflux transporter MFP subunit
MDNLKKLLMFGSLIAAIVAGLCSCASSEKASASVLDNQSGTDTLKVGVTKPARKSLDRKLTVSAELVPFQEIDVYAKESGYVRQLFVDYGTRVKKDQVMAILEIPELEIQLKQDDATIKHAQDEVVRAQHDLARVKAVHETLHLQYKRLSDVAKTKAGLIAQQELDDAQGKDLAGEAQVDASQAAQDAAQSELASTQVKRQHDQVLFDYSKITAPFAGVVTQRYANLGTLIQAGTSSSTQAMPLVHLSEDDIFRLVIPIPESYVRYIKIGDPATVSVAALGKTFTGEVKRFSPDVVANTRTMHTEVDVRNTEGSLVPGLYAEATLLIEQKKNALSVPLQAISRSGDQSSIFVVGPGNKLEVKQVMLGIQTANDAEITSGISPDEQIVVSDRSGLKAGQVVTPQTVQVSEYQGQQQD